jgi:hypothetical protein
MSKMQPRFRKRQYLVLGAATLMLLGLQGPANAQSTAPQAQSTAPQDRQSQDRQGFQSDDITRRDLARFDQFLDGHREVAEQLRKTPSLIDDPQYLQRHPELNTYLQDHQSVRQEITQRPDTFMRLEDVYDRDSRQRDRDAGGQDRDADRRDGANDRDGSRQDRDADRRDVANDRDAGRQDRDADRRDAANDRDAGRQDRDADRRDAANDRDGSRQDRDADRRDAANDRDGGRQDRDANRGEVAKFDRFLDDHREISEQVRKNPSLLDDRKFVESHPALQAYLHDNPGVREQLRQDPNAFMRREDFNDREARMGNRDASGQDRDFSRRDVANLDRFLDDHREIAEQVRKNPSLLDNRNFVQSHPALQTYLQDNPGVREQLKQDPNALMRQEEMHDRDTQFREREPMPEHLANFGGFLGSHSDIQRDLSRDPSMVKDHAYVQNHAELNTYLNAHPDVRAELMADPPKFVQGAQQYNGSATGTVNGSGVNGRGTATTSTSTGTSANRTTTTTPKPNQ